jgi:hypothetical protein
MNRRKTGLSRQLMTGPQARQRTPSPQGSSLVGFCIPAHFGQIHKENTQEITQKAASYKREDGGGLDTSEAP